MKNTAYVRLPAIQIRQGRSRVIYSFAVDGKLLQQFTSIARLGRDDDSDICGYQRPEVLSHIGQIREYLESASPMLPNSIVVAFDRRVKFEPCANDPGCASYGHLGTLVVPLAENGEHKVGWIVDGQQRAAAIREAKVKSFPISAVGFIAAEEAEQREQFILVNSTKPLPKGLLYELLPATQGKLPDLLQRRRFPAHLLQLLNRDADSPLNGLIATPTTPGGVIKDNSILKMVENSLTDGVLYRFRDPRTSESDIDAIAAILKNYWGAVKTVFSESWGLSPRESRLMHGAGIVSLGFLMDAIADRHRKKRIVDLNTFIKDLQPIKDECRWTDGYWDFGPGAQRKWNEIQNTTRDIQVLSNHLLLRYKAIVWSRAGTGTMPDQDRRKSQRTRKAGRR